MKEEITLKNLGDTLVNLIVELREQRGPGFVQTKQQLLLLYAYAHSLLQAKK